MIEKLKWIESDTQLAYIANEKALEHKINELVDAVNKLQKDYDNVCIWVGEQNLNYNPDTTKGLSTLVEEPEPADPYAEQRKWIGKLCWVWDDDSNERAFSKLTEIIEDDDDRPFKAFSRWKHCEPIKPDDDIIYKGDDNETLG